MSARASARRTIDARALLQRRGVGDALACALLAFTVLVVFWPRVSGGGWHSDDWSIHADLEFDRGGVSGAWSKWLDAPVGYRTLYYPYQSLVHDLLGKSQHGYLLLATLTAVGLGLLVYALTRRLGAPVWLAGTVATLGSIHPFASFTKIWATAHVAHVAVGLMIAGLLVAIRGLDARSRPAALAWHVAALTVVAAGLCTYEIGITVFAASGFAYAAVLWPRHAGDIRARSRSIGRSIWWRWGLDLLLCGCWYLLARDGTFLERSQSIPDKTWQVVGDGFRVIASSLLPMLQDEGTREAPIVSGVSIADGWAVAAVAFLLAAAIVGAVAGGRARRLAALAGVGLVLAYLSWAVIVPAGGYYRPIGGGESNRVNVVAAFPLALLVVCCACAGAEGVLRLAARFGRPAMTDRATEISAALVAAMIAILVIADSRRIRGEIRVWNAASREQLRELGVVGTVFPRGRPPADAIVLLTNNVEYIPGGGEVFFTNWPLRGAMRTRWGLKAVTGFPHRAPARYLCRRSGVSPFYIQYAGTADGVAPYGRVHFVDVQAARRWSPKTKAQCDRTLREAGLVPYPIEQYPAPKPGTT